MTQENISNTIGFHGVWVDVLVPLQADFSIDEPKLASHLRNLSAGVAAGAIGASQYDPDAIEATAARVRENKFAAGGAVKYDPGAVDRIITKLREVNRG